MSTQRVIVAAVLAFAFALAWGTLMFLSVRSARYPGIVPDSPLLDRTEIAQHSRPEDCWIVIHGKVYDVTDYIPSHPASPRTITDYCGKESTWAFETKERGRPHSPQAWQLLETFRVGEARD